MEITRRFAGDNHNCQSSHVHLYGATALVCGDADPRIEWMMV